MGADGVRIHRAQCFPICGQHLVGDAAEIPAVEFLCLGAGFHGLVHLRHRAHDELGHVLVGVFAGRKHLGAFRERLIALGQMGVAVGVQTLGPGAGQHSRAVSAAHLADVMPQIFIAHHAGQHAAFRLALLRPCQNVVVHAAVDDKGFVRRGRQFLRVRLGGIAGLFRKSAAGKQLFQFLQRIFAAVQTDGQRRMVQDLFAHLFQLFAHGGPIGLFQQVAQEVVARHAAASFAQRRFHRIVTGGADQRILVAHLDELLFDVQLFLIQHPLKGFLGLGAGQFRLIQPLAAQLNGLFETAFQQTHVQRQLGMAGVSLLPSGPEADTGTAVAQPCAAQGVQLAGGVLGGVQLVQHIGQQVEILDLFFGQPADVIVEVQIQASLGRMMQKLCSRQLSHNALGALVAVAEVRHGQRMVQHQLAVGAGRLCFLFLLGQGGDLNNFHRFRRKQAAQKLVEPASVQLLPQGREQLIGVEQQSRVLGVEPAGGRMDGVQHAVGQTARSLQRSELRRIQAGQQQVRRDALFQQRIHGLADAPGELRRRFLGRAAQDQFQDRLQGAVVEANVDVCPQLFFQQSGFQRRLVGPQQGIQQNFHAQLALAVCECARVPCQSALDLIGFRFFGIVGNFDLHAGLLILHSQAGLAGPLGHLTEVVLVQKCQLFCHVHLAVQGHTAVVGAVVAAVDPHIFLIGQCRDGRRVAARNESIRRIREHRPFQRIFQLCVRRSQCALHLVVHDAAHRSIIAAMPALLLEHPLVHHGQRAEHGVQIDVHQVLEVRLVRGRERIHRLVGEGHRVQEGCHAALEQLQERRSDRIFFRTSQHRMLQNVEHAGVVRGERTESDAERLVHILVFHQKNGRAADIVGQNRQRPVLFGAILTAQDRIAGILLHCGSPFLNGFCFIVSRWAVRRNKQKSPTAVSHSRGAEDSFVFPV